MHVFSRRLLRKQGEDAVKGGREGGDQSRPQEPGRFFIHQNFLRYARGEGDHFRPGQEWWVGCYHSVCSQVLVLHQQTAAVDWCRWNQMTNWDCWVIKAWTRQPRQTFLKCKVDNYQRAAACLSSHLRITQPKAADRLFYMARGVRARRVCTARKNGRCCEVSFIRAHMATSANTATVVGLKASTHAHTHMHTPTHTHTPVAVAGAASQPD